MTVEEAVAEHLASTAAIVALVGTRVYQFKLPQSPTLPAVRVTLVDDPRNYHLRGAEKLSRARIQVDHYADETAGGDPYLAANALADASEAAMSGATFRMGSPANIQITGAMMIDRRPLYEPNELRQVRIMQEFIVWSRETVT